MRKINHRQNQTRPLGAKQASTRRQSAVVYFVRVPRWPETFLASGLSAHFAKSVLMGSTLSHLRQRYSVWPVLSVIAIKRLLQFGHLSMTTSRFRRNIKNGNQKREVTKIHF